MQQNLVLRGVLIIAGLGLLIGDLGADRLFFAVAENRTAGLLLSASLRNLLTLAAVIALLVEHQVGQILLLAAGLLGLVRRLQFVSGLSTILVREGLEGPLASTLVGGLDLLFRVVLVAVAIDLLRRPRPE
ncbi:MAG: hypothetical protein AB7S38_08470 [Vulcanimicrobiota bacterium]